MNSEKKFPFLHVILFVATFISTIIAGAYYSGANFIKSPIKIVEGLPFSIALMSILLCHEFAHYFMSRVHRVKATLPFFIPAPTIIGTIGAVIKMKSPILTKKALIDIGASGPIAGFVVAVISSIVGLRMSEVIKIKEGMEAFYFGNSILFYLLGKLIFGDVPEGYAIALNSVGFAGWVGFLVTALNLIPVGQLDGGHIAFALMGTRHRTFSFILIFFLITMGVLLWPGWLVWAFLLIILGVDHPPILQEYVVLDRKRKYIAFLCFLIFILTFTPVPFSMGS